MSSVRRSLGVAVAFAAALPLASPAATAQEPSPKPVQAASYLVIDAGTGDVVASRDTDRPLPVASLQKMLTALLVVEHAKPSDIVTISFAAAHAQADRVIWPERTSFTVEQLLYGMMLESSNGAAIALAEHVAGSHSAFAQLMDEKAAELGATGSHFARADGLDAPGQYSTAHDIAVVTQTLLAHPMLSAIVQTRLYDIPWPDGTTTRLHNINRFLLHYPGSIGVKTGYTSVASNCLAAAATRDGRTIIAVVLRSTSVTDDATALMDEAFARLGPGPAPEPASRSRAGNSFARRRPAAPGAPASSERAAGAPGRWNGRMPSAPGLAIVTFTFGFVAMRRTRSRRRA